MDKNENVANSKPALWISLIPVMVLAAMLVMLGMLSESDIMNGGCQLSMFTAAAVTVTIAMAVYKVPWQVMENRIIKSIASSTLSILVLLLIGALSGTWMLSGVVPTMICYGLEVLHPSVFLFAVCIISAVVSVVTGSSWTTCATVGVAFMGIGYSMGFPAWWTAGAVISGAYFGDKLSPLSDTTVLASSTSGVPLFPHIRYMLYTTIPSMTIALIVYLFVGFYINDTPKEHSNELAANLVSVFNISPWLLAVPLITFLFIIKRVPVLITLFASVVVACIAMLLAQPEIVIKLGGDGGGFACALNAVLKACCESTSVQTGSSVVDALVTTRGMAGMLNTVWLILAAMTFGGVFMGSGMANAITDALLKRVHGVTGVVTTTVFSGFFFNLCTADQYMSIILTSDLNRQGYDRLGIDRRVLSRATEDSATILSVLVPWNSCGIAQSAVLGIATVAYMPYCVFNIVSPFMSVLVAWMGYRILRKTTV